MLLLVSPAKDLDVQPLTQTVAVTQPQLLEQSQLSASDTKALDRARRATLEMKTTIEMFLCLARETDDGLYHEQFYVMPLVTNAIELQRHLLSRKSVAVDIDQHANPVISGHPQAFAIAVNNLVRNAFEHTLTGQGPITIRIAERELLVSNQLSHEPPSQQPANDTAVHGYGLGLGIVQRLCERNGWAFALRAEQQHVIARLSW